MLPVDPVMRLSFVNTKLRDYYDDLDAFCLDLDIDKEALVKSLEVIDYHYDAEKNQFT